VAIWGEGGINRFIPLWYAPACLHDYNGSQRRNVVQNRPTLGNCDPEVYYTIKL